jgi:hypothetical protein
MQYGEETLRTDYTYDGDQMIEANRYGVGGDPPGFEKYEFVYDAQGGLIEVWFSTAWDPLELEETIVNDGNGLPASYVDGESWATYEIADGRVVRETYVDVYDEAGVTMAEWEDISYDEMGRFLGGPGGEGTVVGEQVLWIGTWEYGTDTGVISFEEWDEDLGEFVEFFHADLILNEQGFIQQIYEDGELTAEYFFEPGEWDRNWWIEGGSPFYGT